MVQLRNYPLSYPFAAPAEHRRDLERGAQALVQFGQDLDATFDRLHKPTAILRGQSGVQSGGAASYDNLIRVDPNGATMMLALPPPRAQDAGRGFRVACVGSGTIGLRTSATRINGLTQYFYPQAEGLFEVRFDGMEFVTFPAPASSWAPIGSATGQALTWDGSTGGYGPPNFYQLPLQAGSVSVRPSAAASGAINMGRGAPYGEIHAPAFGGGGDVVVVQVSGTAEQIRFGDATSGVIVVRNDRVILRPASGASRFTVTPTDASFSVSQINVGTAPLVGGASADYTAHIGASGGMQLAGPAGPVYVGGVRAPADSFDAANKAYVDADIKLHWRGIVGTMSPTQPRYMPENDFAPGNIGLHATANVHNTIEPGVAGVARRMHVFRYGISTGPVPSPGPSGTCTGAGAFVYSLERNGTAVATGSVGTLLSYFAVSMVASYAATDQLAIGVRAPSGSTWGPTFLTAHHIVLEGYAN